MRLTERKRIYLYTYAESNDTLQRYKFKSVDSEKLCNQLNFNYFKGQLLSLSGQQ